MKMERRAFWAAPLMTIALGFLAAVATGQEAGLSCLTLAETDASPLSRELAAEAPAQPQRLPAIEPSAVMQTSALDPSYDEGDYITIEELKAEMRQLAWTKGDFRIVPYGFLRGAMAYETMRSNTGDFTLWVFSADDWGDDAFHVDARASRLGLDITGPSVWLRRDIAQTGGRVEFDFHGQAVTRNRSGVLLRHAYLELKSDRYRLLAGQTWDVISPLNPSMLMYSVAWGGGNLGYRRAQFRGERYFDLSETVRITAQGSLNANIVSCFIDDKDIAGDPSGWPVIQGRVATTLGHRRHGGLPMELGVSGHIGEQAFRIQNNNEFDRFARRTWSFNADFRVPMAEHWGFKGEFFTGENLGAYMGGVLQGVDRGRLAGIRSTGGWVDLWYDWTPRWHSAIGAGIDDPVDGDLTAGRKYNHFYFVNLSHEVTEKFLVGVEVSHWKTLWVDRRAGDSVRLELVAKYDF